MSLDLIPLETLQEVARQYGYWAVFFGIALENAGIPLPGETITIVGGFLAGSGELNYWFVLSSAIAGAVLGDNCGYWIGRRGGWSFLLKLGQLFRISEARLLEVKDQFSQNAVKAVFFGRFITLLRVFAGPLAGIVEMSYGKFFLCNLAGATVWAGVMVTLAFFAGRVISLEQLVAGLAKFGVLVLLGAIAFVIVPIWLKSRQVKVPVKGEE